MKYKIISLSDIHGRLSKLKPLRYKQADFLFVVGDLTNIGLKSEFEVILDEINSYDDIKHKVVVLGNHDAQNPHNTRGMSDEVAYRYCKRTYPNITFLKNEVVEIDGLKIYGTPYVGRYGGWAFQYDPWDRKDKTIPTVDVDIILSHEPPSSIELSFLEEMDDIGNYTLRQHLENNKVDLLFSGHVHECGGNSVEINGCKCYNVAGKIMEVEYEKISVC